MEISEVFYFVATIAMISITVILGVLTYQLYLTLKAVQFALLQANNVVDNIKNVSSGMQFGFWALLTRLFSNFSERR